ncbi:hypothetical protein BZA02_10917 [Ruegeria sp. P4]|uniref:Uncharacterized protein n=1 Tax=Tritonibacter mobilis F1926 TaxID=1265309 RepID=A0A1B1A8S6_9RHOB|nr:hypothetical protein K529_019495 [Tritonibacter mobilis F1926]PXW78799.1 hypothetical protein BZA02_10917 [Ruegeria sp. P4]
MSVSMGSRRCVRGMLLRRTQSLNTLRTGELCRLDRVAFLSTESPLAVLGILSIAAGLSKAALMMCLLEGDLAWLYLSDPI